MSRVYNFSAGPAMLPQAVLQRAQQELLDWDETGMCVMEMSHRGKEFLSIAQQAEADLREIMAIPDNYKVLFLQGGASAQFSAIPMNLLRGKTTADYFNTGQWSKKAIAEAKRYCDVNIVASSEDSNFTTVPEKETWNLNPDAAYVHYTTNETIGGVEFDAIPDTGDVPLVVDISSTILSRPVDVSKFALIYAGVYYVSVTDTPVGSTYFKPNISGGLEVTSKRDFFFYLLMNIPLYGAMAVLTWKVTLLGLLTGFAANAIYVGLFALYIFQSTQVYKVNKDIFKKPVDDYLKYNFKQVAILSVAYAVTFGSELAVVSMLPLFFRDVFVIPMALAGIFGASFAIIDVLSCPSGGWISDTFGRKKSLAIALIGAAVGFFVMSQITG